MCVLYSDIVNSLNIWPLEVQSKKSQFYWHALGSPPETLKDPGGDQVLGYNPGARTIGLVRCFEWGESFGR